MELSNLQKALLYFKESGIKAFIDDGSLYVALGDFEGHEVQISQSEVDYRADLYDELS